MTNTVLTAITVILTTNVVETTETTRGDVKLRATILTESHSYEIGSRRFYHSFPPTTNVVRMELRWVEAPLTTLNRSAPPEAAQISAAANCVTWIGDVHTWAEVKTNAPNNNSLSKVIREPEMAALNVGAMRALTADEAVSLFLPPVLQFIEAVTQNPR